MIARKVKSVLWSRYTKKVYGVSKMGGPTLLRVCLSSASARRDLVCSRCVMMSSRRDVLWAEQTELYQLSGYVIVIPLLLSRDKDGDVAV
jgi:hypothetical protein